MAMSIWEKVLSNVAVFQPQDREALGAVAESDPRQRDVRREEQEEPGRPARVIGREEEVAAFDAYLERAREGQGSMLLLTGSGGSGKTFLLKKLRDRALKERVPAFYGRTSPGAASDPYQPIFSALGLGFDSQGRIIQVNLISKTTDVWGIDTLRLAIDLTRDFLRLAPVVGQVVSVGTLVTKIGKWVYQNRQRSQTEGGIGTNPTFEALRTRLGEMMGTGRGEPRPLVLLLDDLHLARETTFRLLDYILSTDWPLLIVAAWNSDAARVPILVSDAVARVGGRAMPLRPLSVQDAHELVLRLGNKPNFSPAIRAVIADRARTLAQLSAGHIGVLAAGVEYLAQGRDPALLDQLLQGRGEERIAGGGTGGAALLHALAGQQIEQLSERAQDLLSCAALVGDSFPPRVLTRPAMLAYLGLSEREALRMLLSQAEARRILASDPEEPDELAFSSAVTRQLLLRRVPEAIARRDHRMIAGAWQDALGLAVPRVEPEDETHQNPDAEAARERIVLGQAESEVQAPPEALLIGQHFAASGDPLMGLYYARLCGRTLLQRRAYPEAFEAFEQALRYLDALPPLATPEALAVRAVERVKLLQASAYVEEARSRLPGAVERLNQALETAEAGGQREALPDILAQLGWVCFKKDDIEDARRYLERAYSLYGEVGNTEGMAHVDYYLGAVFSQAREYDRAVAAFQRCLRTSQEAGVPDTDVDLVLLELGQVFTRLKRYEEAEVFIDRGLEIAQQQGDDLARTLGLRYRGRLWLDQRKVEALDTLREAREVARETLKDAYLESTISNALALALERFNRMDEARSAYMEALPILERSGNSYGLGAAYGGLGRLALNRGQFGEAADYLRKDLEIVLRAPKPNPVLVSQLLTMLARATRSQGDLERGAETIAQSLEVAGHVEDRQARDETLGYGHLEAGWQALEAGDQEKARQYLAQAREELGHYPPAQAEVSLLHGAVATAAGRLGEAARALRTNLEALQRMPQGAADLYTAALTHLQIAEICLQGPTDETDADARPWARRALDFATNLGNEALAARARKILEELETAAT